MRGSKGGAISKEKVAAAARSVKGSDLVFAGTLFAIAVFVHFGGLQKSATAAAASYAAPHSLLRQAADAMQPPTVLMPIKVAVAPIKMEAAPAPAPEIVVAPRPPTVAEPEAPAPAPVAAKTAVSRPRPTPPSRPDLGGGNPAPSLPPLADTDPAMPTVPLTTATFVDGGVVNVYPHELAERKGLPTLAERDWWPTTQKGWERDTQHGLRAALSKRAGTTYIDFGSWIGPTVLFAAPYAAHVYALEPDTGAYRWGAAVEAQQCLLWESGSGGMGMVAYLGDGDDGVSMEVEIMAIICGSGIMS